jgi:hypothetical protein
MRWRLPWRLPALLSLPLADLPRLPPAARCAFRAALPLAAPPPPFFFFECMRPQLLVYAALRYTSM